MLRARIAVLAFALSLAAQAGAQTREDLDNLIATALPDGRPVAFTYSITSNFSGDRYATLDMAGTFEGRTRLAFDLTSPQWPSRRKTSFLATETRTAFRETPPPEGQPEAWSPFAKDNEAQREKAYSLLLMPQQFAHDLSSYAGPFEETGSAGFGEIPCTVLEGPVAEDRILSLALLFGFAPGAQDKTTEMTGLVRLWIGREDGLLRGAELSLVLKLEKAAEQPAGPSSGGGAARPAAGGDWSDWGPETELHTAHIKTPEGGSSEEDGGGFKKGDKAKEVEKSLSIKISLDQVVEEGAKPAAPIQPDSRAAEIVGW